VQCPISLYTSHVTAIIIRWTLRSAAGKRTGPARLRRPARARAAWHTARRPRASAARAGTRRSPGCRPCPKTAKTRCQPAYSTGHCHAEQTSPNLAMPTLAFRAGLRGQSLSRHVAVCAYPTHARAEPNSQTGQAVCYAPKAAARAVCIRLGPNHQVRSVRGLGRSHLLFGQPSSASQARGALQVGAAHAGAAHDRQHLQRGRQPVAAAPP
jgi:hypothetical protein